MNILRTATAGRVEQHTDAPRRQIAGVTAERVLTRQIVAQNQVDVSARLPPGQLGVVAAGLGFRTVARQLIGIVPGFGWAVKGGIAYAATRAVGEAAAAYFAAGGTRLIGGSVRPRS